MQIDAVSYQLALVSLWLDNQQPGLVSEVWFDEELKARLRTDVDGIEDIEAEINKLKQLIADVKDSRRHRNLKAMLESLKYQIERQSSYKVNLPEAFLACYGLQLNRPTAKELEELSELVRQLLANQGFDSPELFYKQFSVPVKDRRQVFLDKISHFKQTLPSWLTDFPDTGFEVELVDDKPWSAFNYHLSPGKSKIELNSDVSLTELDLNRMAFHEAYGGHHSELSHKDVLLTQQGRGEHGFVLVYSPQVIVSEAIAEGCYDVFVDLHQDKATHTAWAYDRLIFAAQSLAAHLWFEDEIAKEEIRQKLSQYPLTQKTIDGIINFATDNIFGVYAPVYHVAYKWFMGTYAKVDNKQQFLKEIYTLPTTPDLY